MSPKPRAPDKSAVPNHEVVVLTVHLLGGQTHHIDTEDVAVKANEIAPGRFTWRKHKDQISIEHVRVSLSDAAKEKKGPYLIGSHREGWMLTEPGVELAGRIMRQFVNLDLGVDRLSPREKTWVHRERRRMLSEPAFEKLQQGRGSEISSREVETFFHLDDYITGPARETKLQRFLNLLGDDPDVGEAIRTLHRVLAAEDQDAKQ